jgi:chemotaxis protein CheD
MPLRVLEVLLAGMGEIKVAHGEGVLGCIGLGSCVGVVLYDPATGKGALAHVMLPEPPSAEPEEMPGKYATTAIPALLKELGTPAAAFSRLKAVLIGGAELFQNRQHTLQIGRRNVEKLLGLLEAHRIPIIFEDTGGHHGRSFELDLATGQLTLRAVGQAPVVHNLAMMMMTTLAKAS